MANGLKTALLLGALSGLLLVIGDVARRSERADVRVWISPP